MRRILAISLILLFTNILQGTYFQGFEIRGVIPNFYIIVIVSFALLRGSKEGAIVGFFAGLLQDIYYGTTVGFYALLGVYIGYFSGKINKSFYRENFFLPLILTIVSSFFYDMAIYIFTYLIRGRIQISYYFYNIILPGVVYTGVFSIFIYQGIYFLNEKLEIREKKYRNFFK